MVEVSLGELAARFGLRLRGDPDLTVNRVASLAQASPGTLSFLVNSGHNSRYKKQLGATRATAVVLAPIDETSCPVAALIDSNPYLAFAHIAGALHPAVLPARGVHPTAVIATTARIASTASVGAFAVIEDDVEIADRVLIGPGCLLQHGSRIAADTRLMAKVTLYPKVTIGNRCIIHAGVVLGADGFGFVADRGAWVKIPQVGSVKIGDDVEIGANTTVDRGAMDDTVIEDGVKLDNQIQVGHNTAIGAHTAVAGCVGISGSTIIGKRCMIGGGVGIAGQLTIADDVMITGYSLVTKSIRQPGSYSSGMPAVATPVWRRIVAHLRRLPE
ncbi:MAG TPA: UDP-3-O-(3-hydroxymyristoyl)glucosamine N-acyltransferase [Candidatus Binataceae bacterium]|nr:UDP-3-O-(3-hydroxymyristoyl)glucosamine N-acyltransferase [Candidatus Binataceae bacterium]